MHFWTVADLFVWFVCLATAPFFGLMLIIAVAALFRGNLRSKTVNSDTSGPPPTRRFLVVVPAHDEESGIVATVTSCKSVNYPDHLFEVLVVADNCTDATAGRARDSRRSVCSKGTTRPDEARVTRSNT